MRIKTNQLVDRTAADLELAEMRKFTASTSSSSAFIQRRSITIGRSAP